MVAADKSLFDLLWLPLATVLVFLMQVGFLFQVVFAGTIISGAVAGPRTGRARSSP